MTEISPLLSIVIPAYNVDRFIGDAIRSALNQTMSDLEVLVVDDGSTDRTLEEIGQISDNRLHVIRQENRGLAAARNTGVRAARGAFVGFLDGDDMWHPDKAVAQIAILERLPEVVMTYSNSAYVAEDGRPTGEYLVSGLQRPTLRQMIRRNHAGNGSTPILRVQALRRAGMFDERLRTNGEDYELWCRLLYVFGPGALFLIPDPLTFYRIRDASLSMRFDNFLHYGEVGNAILRTAMPDMPNWIMREGLASFYRIASRKAASVGRTAEAARYLWHAVRLAPWLPLTDPRVAATLALILTGGSAQHALHSIHRRVVIGSAGSSWGRKL